MSCVIKVEALGKQYQLGATKATELRHSLAQLLAFGKKREPRGDFWALKDISFELQAGEVLGVIGRNGAGKSTLLKLLAQITAPSRGQISIWGRVASLLEVGTGFHPELTGRENIFLNASILGMKRTEVIEKFDEIVDFSGVEAFIDTPIKKYSSGMRVRLAFAVAAHLEPEILLIDEVLSVGDAAFQKKCLDKMNEVAGSGRTILFVSHNMAAVESLCSRCILLEEGQIISSGEPAEVCAYYLKMLTERPLLVEKKMEALDQQSIQLHTPTVHAYQTEQAGIIRTGDAIKIGFKYQIPEQLGSLRRASFRIIVNDQLGQRLFICDMDAQDKSIEMLEGKGSIQCITEPLKLLGGQYHIDIRLNSALVKHKIKNFASFEVFAKDHAGQNTSLRPLKKGFGYFAVSANWTSAS